MNPTINETVIGRTTCAFAEALEEIGVDDNWMSRAMKELLPHVACELIVHEQNEGRPLTLQEAAQFLCKEAGK